MTVPTHMNIFVIARILLARLDNQPDRTKKSFAESGRKSQAVSEKEKNQQETR